jgi:hypothetical protein
MIPEGATIKARQRGSMPIAAITTLLALLPVPVAQSQTVRVHITTSDAVDFVRMIVHDAGYDVAKADLDLIEGEAGKPFVDGYIAMDLAIDGYHVGLILIHESTAQAIDENSCNVFDYPDLRPFQERMAQLSKAPRKTPQELANDVGCESPKVLTKPVPLVRPH